MANVKVETDVVLDRLMDVFRSVGYDGASMAALADATGLQKASLYHRFPGGKQEMAEAVLDHVSEWNQQQLTGVLYSSLPAETRLTTALTAIYQLYEGGQVACILRALSHGTAAELFRERISAMFNQWIEAFAHLAQDFGLDPEPARRLGESTLIRVQGSLILAQTLRQPSLFTQALADIKTDFTDL